MAYGKAKSIPPDQKGSVRLHTVIGKLQQTLVESIPVLIGRLIPGTFSESPRSEERILELILMMILSREIHESF